MTIFKDWLIIFASAALLVFSDGVAGNSKLTLTLEPRSIMPGERAKLTLHIEPDPMFLEDGGTFPVQIQDDLLRNFQKTKILDVKANNNSKGIDRIYEITSYNVGEVYIPPIEVQIGADSLSTEATPIKVTTTRPELNDEIHEEFGPIPLPFQWQWWLKAIAIIAVLLLIMYSVLLFKKRKPMVVEDPQYEAPQIEPLIWLKARLQSYRLQLEEVETAQEALSASDPKITIDELSSILKEFFSRVSSNPIQTWTTSEFQAHFTKDDKAQRIGKVLSKCDKIKFDSQDGGLSLNTATDLLEQSEKILLT